MDPSIRACELRDRVFLQAPPSNMEACGRGRVGHPGQRVTVPGPRLPSEAFLIPAPYYGAITQHVYLYGGVRLVCVYLDSEVRVPATAGRTRAFLQTKTFLSMNLRVDMGGSPC